MDSILLTIKKLLGIAEDDDSFDSDLVVCVNTVLMNLTQIGIGPPEGFMIYNELSTWEDFLGEDTRKEAVKSYVHLKVRLLFDNPTSSAVAESINRMLGEIEWRLYVGAGQY